MLRLTTRDEFAEIAADEKKRKKFIDGLALELHNQTTSLIYKDIDLVGNPNDWRSLAHIALRFLT